MSPEEKHYLVSIITVTKNCGPTIARTLESIRSVKSSDIQYVLIDGESTDGTLDIIRSHGDLVDILISEKDSGVYNAMNKGAALATGQYVLFLNGDDYLLADGFNSALGILRSENPKILSCRSNVCWRNEQDVEVLVPRPFLLPFFNAIPHLSTFIDTSIQRKFKYREDMKIASDYDLFLRLLIRGYSFKVSNLITAVHYRGGGISADRAQSAIEIEKVKRDNLGWLYFIIRFLEWSNQHRKRMRPGAMAAMPFKRILNKLRQYLAENAVQTRNPKDIARLSRGSLLFSYSNVFSQVGQDGIIHEILNRIGPHLPQRKAFVEFGAWDGIYLSNCRWLVEQGWHGVFIEGDVKKYARLKSNYRELRDKVTCVNSYVGAPKRGIGTENLAGIVRKAGTDLNDVGLIVIDVDGLDLEIFHDLGFQPAVILMEGGHSFSPRVEEPIPVADAAKNIHQPLAYIMRIVKEHGYTPVCFHQDLYLIRSDLDQLFHDCPKSAEQLYADSYYFLTPEQREHIHKFRAKSDVIKNHETEVLGTFSPNPLAFLPEVP